jgi:rhamnosyltransferase
MKPSDVLAVVVSYNGRGQIRDTVLALRTQVGHVHIVDNGSLTESLGVLEGLEREANVSVERLGENRGVGYALNRGVERARQMGASWLLTMDQDSLVDGSMISAYQKAIEQYPERICLSPTIKNGAKASEEGCEVGYAITSGNLVRLDLYDQIGLYDEGFFIDCLDFDFSLRVRRAGHHIHRISGASMQHQLGEAVELPTLARKYYALHAPVRRYYMSRNYLYLTERYFFRFPKFIVKLGFAHALLTAISAFLDPDPVASYRAIGRGVLDYLARRDGPYGEHPT